MSTRVGGIRYNPIPISNPYSSHTILNEPALGGFQGWRNPFAPRRFGKGHYQQEFQMKKLIIASACILALSTAGAFAQMQPAPGASSEGNVGPGATSGPKHVKKGMTTGTGSGSARSSKGMS